MPLRISFSRRKSSGNVFENVQAPPEPSFRVLERPQREGTAFSHGGDEHRLHIAGRPAGSLVLKPTLEVDAINRSRGSGGTHNSSSSGGHGGSSSSSARLSSSTLPSSTDADNYEDDLECNGSQGLPNLPSQYPTTADPRPSFSFPAAGRTSSFGGSKVGTKLSETSRKGSDPAAVTSIPNDFTRDRAMTASSYASTAKPPKLEAGDFSLGTSDFASGFGDILGDHSKRKSTVYEELEDEADAAQSYLRTESAPKLHTMRSWDTGDERKGLMSSPVNDYGRRSPTPHYAPAERIDSLFPSFGINHASRSGAQSAQPQLQKCYEERSSGSADLYSSMDIDTPLTTDSIDAGNSLKRSNPRTIPAPRRSLEDLFDTGKASQPPLLKTSSNTSFQASSSSAKPVSRDPTASNLDLRQQRVRSQQPTSPAGFPDSRDPRAPSTSWRADSNQSTPRATMVVPKQPEPESIFDDSALRATVSAAHYYQRNTPSPKLGQTRGKVLTPQQYEFYKQQREVGRSRSDATTSEDEDESDNYEEEDEPERIRREAKQREKQAASLAVHRQQMMKLTGGSTSNLPAPKTRSEVERTNQTSPNILLTQSISSSVDDPDAAVNGKSSGDEDEDVPLGILAAHGFPNKNRRPSRLQRSSLQTTLGSASQYTSYPSSPGSVAGEPTAAGRGNVPAFARNLPPDPYFGASVVNLSNREAPAFTNHAANSLVGTPSSTPCIPPGGLVGIIAGEERARALRRGSPNPAGGYGPLPSMTPPLPQQVASMGSNPAMLQNVMGSPWQAGMQMMPAGTSTMAGPMDSTSQQVAMMQMQFQMMQMMQQMQGGAQQHLSQPAQQLTFPYGQLSPFPQPQLPSQRQQLNNRHLIPGNVQRPTSLVASGQRSISMLNPASAQRQSWLLAPDSGCAPSARGLALGNAYAASLAPSERSNIGQPSRYRPVTPKEEYGVNANDMQRTSTFTSAPVLVHCKDRATPPPAVTIRAVEKSQGSPRAGLRPIEDEDEEVGWEEMRKKREKKNFDWKSKRAGDGQGLNDLIYAAS